MAYLQSTRAAGTPEAVRLTDRVRGLVSELVSLQNEDGGWPWVAGTNGQPRPSDRMTSARVVWSLATAESLGLLTDAAVLDKAATWLAQEFAKVEGGDNETRATLLHALSTRNKASFEQANALNRVRQGLSNVSLAYLALTFANLDRVSLGDEVLGVLGPRGKTEPTVPGRQAPALLVGSRAAPVAPLGRRDHGAGGPGLRPRPAAGARPRGGLRLAPRPPPGDRLAAAQGEGPGAGGARRSSTARPGPPRTAIAWSSPSTTARSTGPTSSARPRARPSASRRGSSRRRATTACRFDIEGRGQFGYAVTLTGFTREFGPDQDRANKPFGIHRRVYWADTPSLDGKPLAAGFSAAIHPQTFENTVTQAALGGKVPISVEAWRDQPAGQPSWERDFLVVEGVPARRHDPGRGLGQFPGQPLHRRGRRPHPLLHARPVARRASTRSTATCPGAYRALPPSLSSAYEPGRRHLGEPGGLKVLAPGETIDRPLPATPDELYARGKALFDAGRLAEAAAPLEGALGRLRACATTSPRTPRGCC